jgi:TetR/AcrR family transcriptional regulator, transcriptional repressor for nem operon
MRYSRQHKDRTRCRIVESAARLFAAGGYAATSIEDIMRDCDLTRGAFYAHFRSKGRLYDEAIGRAAARDPLARDATGRIGEGSWVESMLDEDVEASGLGFLAADVVSAEPEVRGAYGRAFLALSERLRTSAGCAPREERSILSAIALVVGARAVAQATDDTALKRKILASCRESASAILESGSRPLSFFWEPPT